MNELISFFEDKMKANFTTWDIGLLKTYGAIFGLIVGAYFPAFVLKYLWLFVGIFLILMFRYLYLLFIK